MKKLPKRRGEEINNLKIFSVFGWMRDTTFTPNLMALFPNSRKFKSEGDLAPIENTIPLAVRPVVCTAMFLIDDLIPAFAAVYSEDDFHTQFHNAFKDAVAETGYGNSVEYADIAWYGRDSKVDRSQFRLSSVFTTNPETRRFVHKLAYSTQSYTVDNAINSSALETVNTIPIMESLASHAHSLPHDSVATAIVSKLKSTSGDTQKMYAQVLEDYLVFSLLNAI